MSDSVKSHRTSFHNPRVSHTQISLKARSVQQRRPRRSVALRSEESRVACVFFSEGRALSRPLPLGFPVTATEKSTAYARIVAARHQLFRKLVRGGA